MNSELFKKSKDFMKIILETLADKEKENTILFKWKDERTTLNVHNILCVRILDNQNKI